jgi:hypothetical protein
MNTRYDNEYEYIIYDTRILWMFIENQEETFGQYPIDFSWTNLENWFKTMQEWAGDKKFVSKKQTNHSRLKTRK